MGLKNFILSANAKFENKFDSLNKISKNMLIFGQFFLLAILGAILFYANCAGSDSHSLPDIVKSVQLVFENAASGLFILWFGAIFIDYIDKKNN